MQFTMIWLSSLMLQQPAPESRDGLLTGASGLGFLLFLIGGAAALYFTYQELLRRLDAQRKTIAALHEQIGSYQEYVGAIDVVTRKKAVDHLSAVTPMANPPEGVLPALQRMRSSDDLEERSSAYAVGLGWLEMRGKPFLCWLSVHPRSNDYMGHIAVAGETRSGKGTLVFFMLTQLALRATPEQLRVFAIDPKEDFSLWTGKAHNWREPVLGRDPKLIRAAMQAVSAERERRIAHRRRYEVLEWADLPEATRPPILIVYLAEIDLLPLGEGEVDSWLMSEMSTALSEGIIFMLDIQNASRRNTRWRTHIGTYICGIQSRQSDVEPNLGVTVNEVRAGDAIPPNELPGRGYFTVRSGRQFASFHVPLITINHRRETLAMLPVALTPIRVRPLDEEPSRQPDVRIVGGGSGGGQGATDVTPEEEARILRAADQVEDRAGAAAKRVDVCALAFDGRTSGDEYQKTKLVLDRYQRLLPGRRPSAAVEAA